MKIAFVTPWYGPHIPGGMESETRRTVAHLQAVGFQVEILSTCIRDFFSNWNSNYHHPGVTIEEGITVRRFAVEKTERRSFQWASWRLQQGQRLTRAEEEEFTSQMIQCPPLYDYIADHCHDTLYFFIPYLFSTTFIGARICPERSAIVPCLHDESYAYLDILKKVLPKSRSLILHSESELALVEKLFGPDEQQLRRVIGEGVDTDIEFDADRFRAKFNLPGPFMLVVGRRDQGKNTPLLLHYWRRFVQERELGLKLLLIGPGDVGIDEDLADHVIDLGYVTTQDKYDAYAAATVLCQPSIHESFSLVIMESWLAGTPVLVNGHCAVTTEHCRKSNGGLYFTTYPEFAATANYFFMEKGVGQKMGQNGCRYVLANYQWPAIIEKYKQLIGDMQDAG
jgi:glycosyltransferase involved in cell wall biosynthesis